MSERRPPFWKWILFSEDIEGKVWGSIDGISDDAPDDMKKMFWEWIEEMKKTDGEDVI